MIEERADAKKRPLFAWRGFYNIEGEAQKNAFLRKKESGKMDLVQLRSGVNEKKIGQTSDVFGNEQKRFKALKYPPDRLVYQ